MIGKLIRMQGSHVWKGVPWAVERPRGVRRSVVALTTYIVDADPHSLVVERAAEVLSLSSYAMALDALGVEPGEKVEEFGSRNLVGSTLSEWQEQMIAIATRATATSKPILHFILSLEEGECWANGEAEEAIDILLQTLTLERCAVVWSRHGNTANAHLHLCVINVDRLTGDRAGSKWLVDDLHQSLALIDERQNRARVPEALYKARDGAVYDVETGALVRDAGGAYQPDWYKPHGRKRNRIPPGLREARSELIDAADCAVDWQDLHAAFAEFQAFYDRKSSGARIRRSGTDAKASQVHPSLSRVKLEERLGPFEPDASRANAAYEAFRADFDRQLADLRERRQAEKMRIRARVKHLVERLEARRRAVLKKMIEAEADEAEAAIGKAFENALRRCTDQRRTEERWMAEGGRAYIPVATPALLLPVDSKTVDQPTVGPSERSTRVEGWSTNYLDAGGRTLFTDHRHFLLIDQVELLHAIDEALVVASQRWGTVSVQGPAPFLSNVSARAKLLGIDVVGVDGRPLQPVEVARPKLVAEPAQADAEQHTKDPAYEQRIAEFLEHFTGASYLPTRLISSKAPESAESATERLELALDDPHEFWDQRLKVFASLDQDERIQARLRKIRAAALEDMKTYLVQAKSGSFPRTYEELHNLLPKRELLLHRAIRLMRGDHDFQKSFGEARTMWVELERVPIEQEQSRKAPEREQPEQGDEPMQSLRHEAHLGDEESQGLNWERTLATFHKSSTGRTAGE